MIDLAHLEVWFVTGSQHLYGPETLQKVQEHATTMARTLAGVSEIPVKVICKPVMTNSDSIQQLCQDASNSKDCVGLIAWMHTFSPARMWITGLRSLTKPLLHLHTQFNEELPWSTIDMDFMNLNQSAHGDLEFGFIGAPCGSSARSSWVSGKIRGFTQRWAHGYARHALGTMLSA